jgi:hypothetical protein
VLSAETHSGSISSAMTRGVNAAQSAATDVPGSQRKPSRRQRHAVRISAALSRQDQPRAPRMPASRSSGGGPCGTCSPPPSAKRSVSGMRCSTAPGSTPSSRISDSVAL